MKFTGAFNEQEQPSLAERTQSPEKGRLPNQSHPGGWGGTGFSAADSILGSHREETVLSSGQVVPLAAIEGNATEKLPLSEAFSQNPQLLTCG